MIRAVLAAILAVAVLAAAAPGVERARVAESEATLDRSADALRRAASGLAADDATAAGVPNARRTVAVRVPGRAWAEASVTLLAVGCDPDRCPVHDGAGGRPTARSGPAGPGDRSAADVPDLVSYRVRGRTARRVRLRSVELRAPDGPVVLTDPGRHRLRLSLARDGETPVVRVRNAAR